MGNNIHIQDILPPKTLLRLVDQQSVEFMELVESIQTYGLFQPILVRPHGEKYRVIDGLHRFSAMQELKWEQIPCVIKDVDDMDALSIMVQANALSKETSPSEYSVVLRKILQSDPEMTISKLADIIKKSPSWINSCLSLSRLDEETQTAVNRGEIRLTSAYYLARIPVPIRNNYILDAVTMDSSSFREVAAQAIRDWKNKMRVGVDKHYFPVDFKPRKYLRSLREVTKVSDDAAIEILVAGDAKTPLDGWRLAIDWLLHVDKKSAEEQRIKYEKLQTKISELG